MSTVRGVRLFVAVLVATGCCQLTGNFGGGPCPRSAPAAPEPEPKRGFLVDLEPSCSPALDLSFEPNKHHQPLDEAAFARLSTQSYQRLPRTERFVPSAGVTVWAHAPGTARYVPFPTRLNTSRTTHVRIACNSRGEPES